jgi:hypothetical protein
MFDTQGHISLPPAEFVNLLNAKGREWVVNHILMVGTPQAFPTFHQYADFTSDLGHAIGIHGRSIVMRGSAHLGYSISPRPGKVWRVFGTRSDGSLSDLDVAIVDADYFDALDRQVRAWELRQHEPKPNTQDAMKFANRARLRAFECISHYDLPPMAGVNHQNACARFVTYAYCGTNREVKAFVFRSWHALLSRWRRDLTDLQEKLATEELPGPTTAALATPPTQALPENATAPRGEMG